MDLTLNKLQGLIYHKTQPTNLIHKWDAQQVLPLQVRVAMKSIPSSIVLHYWMLFSCILKKNLKIVEVITAIRSIIGFT